MMDQKVEGHDVTGEVLPPYKLPEGKDIMLEWEKAKKRASLYLSVLIPVSAAAVVFLVFGILNRVYGDTANESLAATTTRLNECHYELTTFYGLVQKPMDAVAMENLCGYQDRFEQTLGLLDQCKASLAGCQPAPVCPSPFDDQVQAKIDACKVQLDEIQMRWDAKYKLAEQAIEAARKLGVGPRLREWIANSEAQLAAREVLLSYQDWATVNYERGEAAQNCSSQLFDTVRNLEISNTYEDLRQQAYNTERNPLRVKTDQLFPDWMRWRQMELDLTREAVGCKDDEE